MNYRCPSKEHDYETEDEEDFIKHMKEKHADVKTFYVGARKYRTKDI